MSQSTSGDRSAAARANGSRSRGPVTPEGKARSAQNALKHGLRAASFGDSDPAAFDELLDAFVQGLRPANQMEMELVAALAATRFRLRRVPEIEATLLKKGFEGAPASLSLLVRYESSLSRDFDRTLKQLQAIQKARITDQPEDLPNEPKAIPMEGGVDAARDFSPASENQPNEPKPVEIVSDNRPDVLLAIPTPGPLPRSPKGPSEREAGEAQGEAQA